MVACMLFLDLQDASWHFPSHPWFGLVLVCIEVSGLPLLPCAASGSIRFPVFSVVTRLHILGVWVLACSDDWQVLAPSQFPGLLARGPVFSPVRLVQVPDVLSEVPISSGTSSNLVEPCLGSQLASLSLPLAALSQLQRY